MGRDEVITVDTHIIIWNALKPELLSKKAKQAIERANKTDGMIFCEISLWEIAMLLKKKRIEIGIPYVEFIDLLKLTNNYIFHGINPAIAGQSVQLDQDINLDPADRIICATALVLQTDLDTADHHLRKSKQINTIW